MFRLFLSLTALLFAALIAGCGGRDIEYDPKNYPLHGKQLIFNEPMVFMSGLKERAYNPEEIKYDAVIWRKSYAQFENPDVYQSVQDITPGTVFTVANSFRIIPWGLQTSFSNEVRILVLQDPAGKKYTFGDFQIHEDEWLTNN